MTAELATRKKSPCTCSEGVRFSGNEVEIKKISEIKDDGDLQGYDGYIFGCPTYSSRYDPVYENLSFLIPEGQPQRQGGGAFGSYTHSGDAPKYIFDTMQYVFHTGHDRPGVIQPLEEMLDKPDGTQGLPGLRQGHWGETGQIRRVGDDLNHLSLCLPGNTPDIPNLKEGMLRWLNKQAVVA